jgi:putative oxidoreductase
MDHRLKPILFGGDGGDSTVADLGLLFLRIVVGASLAFAHGLGKMPPSPGFVETTAELGFPFPHFFAWAAGLSEFLGGLRLALGLFTRPASVVIAITMAVATYGRHGGDPFSDMEKSFLYLVIALAFVFLGSGRYGLDRLLAPRRDTRIWR